MKGRAQLSVCLRLSPGRVCVFSPSGVLTLHLVPAGPASFMESRWTQQKLSSPAENHGIPAPGAPPRPQGSPNLPKALIGNLWFYVMLLDVDGFCMTSWYLRVRQSSQVWIKVELNADPRTRQGEPSDQQHNQHHIGEGRSEVDHLYRHMHTATLDRQTSKINMPK